MPLLGNQFMEPIMRSVDFLLKDAERKKNIVRQDQLLADALAREDSQMMEKRRYNLLGNMFNNRNLTPEFRESVGQNLLGMIGKGQYVPEFNPADPPEELYALPQNANDDIYKIFPTLKDYAGKKMWTPAEMAKISNSFAQRKESGRHNLAQENIAKKRLNKTKKTPSGRRKKENDIRGFQLRELERMESQYRDDPIILDKIRRNKVRLGQSNQPYDPEHFKRFAQDPENYTTGESGKKLNLQKINDSFQSKKKDKLEDIEGF